MVQIVMQHVSDTEVRLSVPEIGAVHLHKFSPTFDNGLYAKRPWHVTTFGRNFPTVEECIAFVQCVASGWETGEWDNGSDDGPFDESGSSSHRNAMLIDAGYQAYAREEGHYDLPDNY